MADVLILPKDASAREEALNRLIDEGTQLRHVREVEWWLIHYYLQGAREFGALDYQRGLVDANFYNQEGELKFRYDDIVSVLQTQVGRLMQADLRPSVSKRGIGLEDLQKAATGQVVLDYLFPESYVEQRKLLAIPSLLKYGTIGLAVWKDSEHIGIDIVPPWELVPLPPNPIEPFDTRGIARCRMVPLSWVKQLSVAPGPAAKVWDEMQTIEVPVGFANTSAHESFATFTEAVSITGAISTMGDATQELYGSSSSRKTRGGRQSTEKAVMFVEVWTDDGNGMLKDYTILCGKKEIHHNNWSGKGMRMPIHIARDIPAGGFWGRSFCSILMPINVEIENTLANLLQNVQDADTFGLLCEPTTLGIPTEVMRGTDGIRRIRYEPDYTSPYQLQPFNIAPANTGLAPVHTLKVAVELMQRMSNQPTEMMRGAAPGRVDSGSGLGFLYEVSNMPISPTVASLSHAFIGCYEAALNVARLVWTEDRLVEITHLDDSLMGITLDPSTGQMQLDNAAIPAHDEVRVTVRSMLPKSAEKEKQDLLTALTTGVMDLFEYRIEVRKRGLDTPVGGEAEWQNFRRATLENIILFGGGQKPGEVIVSDRDMHSVHLRVLQNFMSRPEFYLASVEVRDAFAAHYEAHLTSSANTLPDQMPYPEDAAQQQRMSPASPMGMGMGMGMQEMMGGQGGGGPFPQ